MLACLEELTDEETGKVMKAVFLYHSKWVISELDRICRMAFATIKTTLDRDRWKWEEYSQAQSDRAKKRWDTPSQEDMPPHATAFPAMPNDAEHADSVSVSDTVNASVNVNDNLITSKEVKEQALTIEPKEFWNQEINKALEFLKKAVWLTDFKDTQQWQRRYASHIIRIKWEIWDDEFKHRLKSILQDEFKAKNCNKLKYLYWELKSFIHSPVVETEGNRVFRI